MKALIFTSIFLFACSPVLQAASNTFLDYQNYNHGYCPDCNCCPCKCAGGEPADVPGDPVQPKGTCKKPDPCCPPATSTCTQCGLNILYVGAGMALIAAVASIIVSSNNGATPTHLAP